MADNEELQEAVRELAHVARALLDRVKEIDDTPKVFLIAIENKIAYYESRA
jgi:hypothetical protein